MLEICYILIERPETQKETGQIGPKTIRTTFKTTRTTLCRYGQQNGVPDNSARGQLGPRQVGP